MVMKCFLKWTFLHAVFAHSTLLIMILSPSSLDFSCNLFATWVVLTKVVYNVQVTDLQPVVIEVVECSKLFGRVHVLIYLDSNCFCSQPFCIYYDVCVFRFGWNTSITAWKCLQSEWDRKRRNLHIIFHWILVPTKIRSDYIVTFSSFILLDVRV